MSLAQPEISNFMSQNFLKHKQPLLLIVTCKSLVNMHYHFLIQRKKMLKATFSFARDFQ